MTEEEKRKRYSIYAFEKPEDFYKICLLGYYTMQEGPRLYQRRLPVLIDYVYRMQNRDFMEWQVKILYDWYHDKWCSEHDLPDSDLKTINKHKLLIFSYGYMSDIDWDSVLGLERNIKPVPFKEMVEVLLKEFDDQLIITGDYYDVTDYYEVYTHYNT